MLFLALCNHTAPLWHQSGATLRRRLEQLQTRLGLTEDGRPVFDLSSLRPGGATWMLGLTENSELVRRRGRWLSQRVMDIYLQEVVAITYLPSLAQDTRDRLDALAGDVTSILAKVLFFESRRIPRAAWYLLLRPASGWASVLSNCMVWLGVFIFGYCLDTRSFLWLLILPQSCLWWDSGHLGFTGVAPAARPNGPRQQQLALAG